MVSTVVEVLEQAWNQRMSIAHGHRLSFGSGVKSLIPARYRGYRQKSARVSMVSVGLKPIHQMFRNTVVFDIVKPIRGRTQPACVSRIVRDRNNTGGDE